jgi:hypothetical protein
MHAHRRGQTRRPALRQDQKKGADEHGANHPKTVVVVAVVWIVPVAIRCARVVLIVVPRAAAQHLPERPDRACARWM